MSAYSSDRQLTVVDVRGDETEVDVATNLLDGNVRMSILWTDEIVMTPNDAEALAQALLRAAEHGRRIQQPTEVPPSQA